jgi:LytR cell envelope-related transcriptional attenuator
VSWLNLLTPSAAIIAIFLALALVVQSFRHGRQIRRLEQQLTSAGLASYDPTLERLKALSGLAKPTPQKETTTRQPIASRRTQVIVATAVGMLIAAGIAWAVVAHKSSATTGTSAKPTAHPTRTSHASTATGPTTTRPALTSACATAAPDSNPSATTVSVYNGSGVAGAAGKVVGPKIASLGYTLGTIGNAPNGVSNAAVSSIQYVARPNLNAACSVATALGVAPSHVSGLTVMPASQAGNAGVVVLVGRDIAYG